MKNKKIGIISLGLIGGSLLKRLAKNYENITIVTRNKETIEKACAYTQNASDDFNTLKECEIIFVCSPMNKTLEILDKLEDIVNEKTFVADVCILKSFVMKKERPYIFIGSHPMAGTENQGFDASFAELFEGAKWVITPSKKANTKNIERLKSVIETTGAEIIETDADEHDKAAALISHMPMLLAQALMNTAMNNKTALKLASSGFRDMTRLAMSNTEMAEDMMNLNSNNIFNSLLAVIEESRAMFEAQYPEKIKVIKDFRSQMYNKDGKNIL